MVKWEIVHTKRSLKDFEIISQSPLKEKVRGLLDVLSRDPFKTPPPFKKLSGDLKGLYSRRINIQHRLIYQPITEKKIVKVLSMWTHYD